MKGIDWYSVVLAVVMALLVLCVAGLAYYNGHAPAPAVPVIEFYAEGVPGSFYPVKFENGIRCLLWVADGYGSMECDFPAEQEAVHSRRVFMEDEHDPTG